MTRLTVSDLSFSYPDGTEVLQGVNISIEAGERVGLLGPNGAGKTTFALHLNGILRGEKGTISLGGTQLSDQTVREIRRRVGLVFQDPDDQLFMPTVFADVAFGPANFGFPADEVEQRVKGALDSVGEWHLADRAPHHLSGGERRKVAIATVLASDSELLVLDEPTSNLDPAGRRELVALLSSLATTQLIVSHDLPFVLELCPRAVIMDGGQVVADGHTADILSNRALLADHRLELPFGFDPRTVHPA
ncbi:MAG: energy-coupling factor ABC transporter ATP-binding protein [Acidimicrobiia bacterium]